MLVLSCCVLLVTLTLTATTFETRMSMLPECKFSRNENITTHSDSKNIHLDQNA